MEDSKTISDHKKIGKIGTFIYFKDKICQKFVQLQRTEKMLGKIICSIEIHFNLVLIVLNNFSEFYKFLSQNLLKDDRMNEILK